MREIGAREYETEISGEIDDVMYKSIKRLMGWFSFSGYASGFDPRADNEIALHEAAKAVRRTVVAELEKLGLDVTPGDMER